MFAVTLIVSVLQGSPSPEPRYAGRHRSPSPVIMNVEERKVCEGQGLESEKLELFHFM